MNNYSKFLHELAKISVNAPKGKAPKLLNKHLFRSTPFDINQFTLDKISLVPLAQKSVKYMESGLMKNNENETAGYLTDIPIPKCLKRHVDNPSYSLQNETQLTRILGFRIEVKGRRGSRSMKSVLNYGRLDRTDGAAHVDFGKSHFVTRRGVGGVKVWINYGKLA